MSRSPFARAFLALALGLSAAPELDAQIVNTLRGWSDPEPGWTGEVEGRFALAGGNSEYLELSAGGAIQVVASRHRVRALASETLRRANGEAVAESFLAHVRHNYRLAPAVATLAFVQHQYDPFRRLERRTLGGAGLRFDLVRRERWSGSLGASYMIESEELTDDPADEVEVEGRGSFFLSAIGNVTDHFRVDASGFYQPRISDFSDARAYVVSSGRVDVVGGLDLLVRFDLVHDARPPEGVEPTDFALSTGLVFEF